MIFTGRNKTLYLTLCLLFNGTILSASDDVPPRILSDCKVNVSFSREGSRGVASQCREDSFSRESSREPSIPMDPYAYMALLPPASCHATTDEALSTLWRGVQAKSSKACVQNGSCKLATWQALTLTSQEISGEVIHLSLFQNYKDGAPETLESLGFTKPQYGFSLRRLMRYFSFRYETADLFFTVNRIDQENGKIFLNGMLSKDVRALFDFLKPYFCFQTDCITYTSSSELNALLREKSLNLDGIFRAMNSMDFVKESVVLNWSQGEKFVFYMKSEFEKGLMPFVSAASLKSIMGASFTDRCDSIFQHFNRIIFNPHITFFQNGNLKKADSIALGSPLRISLTELVAVENGDRVLTQSISPQKKRRDRSE